MQYVGKVRTWRRGQMTIPARLRKKLRIEDDTILSVYEMGRGILLVPGELVVDRLSAQVEELADREGVSLEEMLEALAQDRYANAEPAVDVSHAHALPDQVPGLDVKPGG